MEREEEYHPDPLSRPDLCDTAGDESAVLWPLPGMPTEPCPCCGADIPENPYPGYICATCWWEIDPFVCSDSEPSDLNHGLSLEEARMNFRAFGVCDPNINRHDI